MTDPVISIATIVELVETAKADAERLAAQIRDAQHKQHLPLDTRADYAEGSAAAYSYTLSVIAGACGVTDAKVLRNPVRLADDATIIEHDPVNDQADAIVAANWPVDHAEGE